MDNKDKDANIQPIEEIENASEKKQKEKNTFLTKIWRSIKKHPMIYILLLILIVVLIGFSIKLKIDNKKFITEKKNLIEKYETKIDSILVKNVEFNSRIFSWSIRSEMMRNNEENLNQLVTVFVNKSDASLVQIVDLEKGIILVSSDKKFEGEKFTIPTEMNFREQKTISKKQKTTVYTPIMGFNNLMGILIVENINN
jgi:chemotaxis signal transduction protein